jgi:zinc transporter ZupT
MQIATDTTLAALAWGTVAAAVSAAGALPFAPRGTVRPKVVGIADALASGFMLAASYLLIGEGLALRPFVAIGCAAVGAAYAWWTQRYAGLGPSSSPGAEMSEEVAGYKMLLQNALHSMAEGLAIGAALAVSIPLGVFVAVMLAAHNVAEGMTLTSELRERGMSLADSAAMCVIVKTPQPLMAIVCAALVSSVPGLLPMVLGVSAGSVLYLVMTELLPASYRRAGASLVSLIVASTAAIVVLLRGMIR